MRIPQQPPSLESLLPTVDLSQLIQAPPGIDALRTEDQERYRHWSKIRIICERRGLDAKAAWLLLKMARFQSRREIDFRSAANEPLWFSYPVAVQRSLHLLDQRLAGRIQIPHRHALTEAQGERYIINSFMEEAIASSQLEGAATTRAVAKEMLRQGRPPRDKHERMILNNYVAINFIRRNIESPLSPKLLLELQAMLTEATLVRAEDCGRFRTSRDTVRVVDPYGEVLHHPPPAAQLSERIDALCQFANVDSGAQSKDPGWLHPIIRAILLHFQVAYDHPFCDGNGRTARAIFYWSALRAGYWLFEYLPISALIRKGPAKYGRAFLYTETDEFDATYFLAHQLEIIERATREFEAYLTRKMAQMRSAEAILGADADLNHRQLALLSYALRHPEHEYTIESHRQSHGVAYATARSDLLELADRGYLRAIRRGRLYVFRAGDRLASLAR